jgi:hypothetical protein
VSANAASARIAAKHGRGYHEVRVAINRIVNQGRWERGRAERYVDEVLEVDNDLERAVDAVLREAREVSARSGQGAEG